jgi:hypothetical protein
VSVPANTSAPAPILVTPPIPERAEASVTVLPLVSKVAPNAPKAARREEMSVEVPAAHCSPPPLSKIGPVPKLLAELKLMRPPAIMVGPE